MRTLSKLTAVITRPERQAESLADLIHQKGGCTIMMPTVSIKPISIINQLKHSDHPPDCVIFTSANAAFESKALWLKFGFKIPTIAIGPGTARALKRIGASKPIIPNKYDSEGLLDLPCLHNIKDKKIFIFCGKNPRTLLQKTLQERHANISLFECYRRVATSPNQQVIETLINSNPNLSITTSRSTLFNYHHIIQNHRINWLYETALLVTHPHQRKLASELGFRKIVTCENATDLAIINTLELELRQS